jgi:hypothetical protein
MGRSQSRPQTRAAGQVAQQAALVLVVVAPNIAQLPARAQCGRHQDVWLHLL